MKPSFIRMAKRLVVSLVRNRNRMLSMNIFDSGLMERERPLLEAVEKEFFSNSPIHYSIDIEGQKLNEEREYVLGLLAGPCIRVDHLFHEMGHFAEREIPKLLEKPNRSWGFGRGKYWEINGQSGYEPHTDQATQREIRAMAYQLSILRHYNKQVRPYFIAMSLTGMPDFHIFRYKLLGVEECSRLGLVESEKKAIQWIAKKIGKLSQTTFTYEAFRKAWNDRIELLRG
jgi:hypothetical protein